MRRMPIIDAGGCSQGASPLGPYRGTSLRSALAMVGLVLASVGCTAVLDPGRWRGAPDGQDGGRDVPSAACTSASDCTGGAPVCTAGGRCLDCDTDGDGYLAEGSDCDELRAGAPADCDDTRAHVHPGAAIVCGDGVVNDCSELPADIGTALGVQELGVVPVVPLYLSGTEDYLELPTMVALQSSGGETNAAIALRARDAAGNFLAWLFPFDHTAPAAIGAPIVASPTSREYYFVSGFHLWQTSPTAATMLVNGAVSEDFRALGVPYFGAFGVGTDSAEVDPVEPNRRGCPFSEIVRDAWSARRDFYTFIARNDDRTVYSLHAVSRTGSIDCVPNLAAVGVNLGEHPLLIAAGDVVIVEAGLGQNYVWKPGGIFDPQPLDAFINGEPPIVTFGDYEYVVASQSPGGARMSHLDCNRREGCVELRSDTVPTASGYSRALTRWGSGAALLTIFEGEPGEGTDRLHGVELRLVDGTGVELGGDFALRPWQTSFPAGGMPSESIAWMDATAVPRTVGSMENDLLVALVMRNSDSTMALDLARVRGCTAR